MHTVALSTVFFPLGIATVVTGIRLVRVRGWRVFAMYSIVAGLAVLVAALGNLSSLFAPTPQTPLSSRASQQVLGGFGGLANRIVVALALAWYVISPPACCEDDQRSTLTRSFLKSCGPPRNRVCEMSGVVDRFNRVPSDADSE